MGYSDTRDIRVARNTSGIRLTRGIRVISEIWDMRARVARVLARGIRDIRYWRY